MKKFLEYNGHGKARHPLLLNDLSQEEGAIHLQGFRLSLASQTFNRLPYSVVG